MDMKRKIFDNISSGYTSSSDESFVLESYPQRIVIASVLILVTIVGIIGNSHVVLAVLLCRKLRSPTNWLVVNLGMADLITCLFLPFNVVAMLSKDGWPIAEWTCAMTGAVTLTCLGASIVSLALIAHNRWVLLTKPRYTFYGIYCKRNIAVMVILSWLYPFLLVIIPPLAGLGKLGYSKNYKTCQQDTTLPNSDYFSLIAGVGVIVPASVIIVVIYVLIYRFVSRHNEEIKRNLAETREAGTSGCDHTSVDMSTSWTDSQDWQRSADVDGSVVSRPDFSDRIGIRPALPKSRNTEDAPNMTMMTCPVSVALPKEEANENMRNVPQIPESADEVCEGAHSAVGEIEVSAVQSQADKRSLNASSPSQGNLELNSISPSSSRGMAVHAPADTTSSKSAPKISCHHINVTKRLSLVVLSFFICFLPFGICVMVPTSDPAVPWANLLAMVNSCINPILYAGTMPMIREVMGHIARCKFQNIPEPVEFVRFCRGKV